MESLIIFLLVGLLAGFLASKVLTGRGMGIIVDMVVGVLGSFVGGWLATLAGISIGGLFGEIVIAFAGAVILLAIFRLMARRGMIRA